MKKVIILLLLFVAFQANAQKFHIIPKVGLNLATMSNGGDIIKPGLNLGASGEIMLSKFFAIEPGLFFSMQSDGYDYANYLNIPVNAKLYLYNGLHLFAGPQFGLNVYGGYETFDFSVGFGAGYQFNSGFLISANYNFGISAAGSSSYYDYYYGNYYYNGDCMNRVFQLNVGWRF